MPTGPLNWTNPRIWTNETVVRFQNRMCVSTAETAVYFPQPKGPHVHKVITCFMWSMKWHCNYSSWFVRVIHDWNVIASRLCNVSHSSFECWVCLTLNLRQTLYQLLSLVKHSKRKWLGEIHVTLSPAFTSDLQCFQHRVCTSEIFRHCHGSDENGKAFERCSWCGSAFPFPNHLHLRRHLIPKESS